MSLFTEIQDAFSFYDQKLQDSSEIQDKLVEIAVANKWTAEEFVDEFMAYLQTNKVSSKSIDLDTSKKFSKHLDLMKQKAQRTRKGLQSTEQKFLYREQEWNAGEVEPMADIYSFETPKRSKQNGIEDTSMKLVKLEVINSPGSRTLNSPVAMSSSLSPAVTPSSYYTSRGGRGQIIASYGNTDAKANRRGSPVDISSVDEESKSRRFGISGDYAAVMKADMDAGIDRITSLFTELNPRDFSELNSTSYEESAVVGRICCDSAGKLNPQSVQLEDRQSVVALDLSQCRGYSVFPGQLVAVTGINPTGKRFVAKEFLGLPSLPAEPASTGADAIRVVSAAGPYTPNDSLDYQPLSDLISLINTDPPGILILMGPFLDEKNLHIAAGCKDNTFSEIFQNILNKLSGTIDQSTTIIIIPSPRDVHHWPVFPQPPFDTSTLPSSTQPRVLPFPNPATLRLASHTLGISSHDVLFSLGREELVGGSDPLTSDRISRLISHLFDQRSYSPLYPPSEDLSMGSNPAPIPLLPRVTLLPSDLKPFVKTVQGSICVNPGRLTKGLTGGSYADIIIADEISVKIIKI